MADKDIFAEEAKLAKTNYNKLHRDLLQTFDCIALKRLSSDKFPNNQQATIHDTNVLYYKIYANKIDVNLKIQLSLYTDRCEEEWFYRDQNTMKAIYFGLENGLVEREFYCRGRIKSILYTYDIIAKNTYRPDGPTYCEYGSDGLINRIVWAYDEYAECQFQRLDSKWHVTFHIIGDNGFKKDGMNQKWLDLLNKRYHTLVEDDQDIIMRATYSHLDKTKN